MVRIARLQHVGYLFGTRRVAFVGTGPESIRCRLAIYRREMEHVACKRVAGCEPGGLDPASEVRINPGFEVPLVKALR